MRTTTKRLSALILAILSLLAGPGRAMAEVPSGTGPARTIESVETAVAMGLVDTTAAVTLEQEGSAEVFVTVSHSDMLGLVDADAMASRSGSDEQIDRLSKAFAARKQVVLRRAVDVEIVEDFELLPVMSVRVTSERGLLSLASAPGVAGISAPMGEKLQLAQSLPLINQPQAATAGHRGAGTYVVVLDTGVQYNNGHFGDCSSFNNSTCKVVLYDDYASRNDGSADDMGHGTNVTGIVLGVAPGAKALVFDVFNTYTNAQGKKDWTTDNRAVNRAIQKAIEWRRQGYNVASINMSFGGGHYDACTASSAHPYAGSLATALSVGIVPVASSGNDRFINGSARSGIGFPACLSSTLSVGAVYEASYSSLTFGGGTSTQCTDRAPARDSVTCFSQDGSALEMLAPGARITAGGRSNYSGTSMAAPHVAGAVAVLKAAKPSASATAIRNVLKTTGPVITDPWTGRRHHRLDLTAALAALGVSGSGAGTSDTTKPVVNDVDAFIRSEAQFSDNGRFPVKVTWKASDNRGITGYELRYKVEGGSWKKVTLSSPTATSHQFTVATRTTINFAVAARDKAGNWSDWKYSGWTTTRWFDESAAAIDYSSGWKRYTNDATFKDDYKATRTAGASVSFTFTGKAVALSATKWDGAGTADVYLDGKYRGTVSFSSNTTDVRRIVKSYYWEKTGTHTLTFKVRSGWISVDTFLVLT